MELTNYMKSNITILIILLIIVYIEFTVEREVLAIIILHNNDHTLNKLLQFISMLMEQKEIHYQILVIKEKKMRYHRSTGFLFNLGYRHLPRYSNYLFIDSTNLNLRDLISSNIFEKMIKLDKRYLFVKDKINFIEGISGLVISRNYFKKIDGFQNKPNKNFIEFMKVLNDSNKNSRYSNISNLQLEYDIIEKVPINNFISKMIINYY